MLWFKIAKERGCGTVTNAKIIPLPYKAWQQTAVTLQLTFLTQSVTLCQSYRQCLVKILSVW